MPSTIDYYEMEFHVCGRQGRQLAGRQAKAENRQ